MEIPFNDLVISKWEPFRALTSKFKNNRCQTLVQAYSIDEQFYQWFYNFKIPELYSKEYPIDSSHTQKYYSWWRQSFILEGFWWKNLDFFLHFFARRGNTLSFWFFSLCLAVVIVLHIKNESLPMYFLLSTSKIWRRRTCWTMKN